MLVVFIIGSIRVGKCIHMASEKPTKECVCVCND